MVLSDFSGEIRAIADVEAFGLMLHAPGERARLLTRHRVGTAAHLLPVDRLPAAINPAIAATTVVTPLSTHAEASHPVVERLLKYDIDCLLLMPLPGDLGLFWAGRRGVESFDARTVADFDRLVPRLAAALHAPEAPDVRLQRLSSIDAVDEMLPVVAGALDVREVFHRLSEVVRSVVPHDATTIQFLSEDQAHLRMYALDGVSPENIPETAETQHAPVFNQHVQFSIHDDLLANPAERNRPTAKAGMRSALRLPLSFDGRIGGTLEFCSSAVATYRETHVPVARHIADYVTLAISHQRMADAARRAATLRERSENLLVLDDLLATLSGVLDMREVFDRVSVIAQKVLRHDAMGVTTILERERRLRVHAVSGFGDDFPRSFETPMPQPELLTDPWEFLIIDDMAADPRYAGSPTVKAGMQSVLGLPVRLEGRLQGGVNFYSRSKAAFTRDTVLVGKRIADHLALALSHQHLAEEARANAELKAQTANLELLDELLAALTDTGELSELVDRVSTMVRKVIAHNAMTVFVMLPDGLQARRYASSGLDAAVTSAATVVPVPPSFTCDPGFDYDLVEDTSIRSEEYNQRAASLGFRSLLRVPIRIGGTLAAGVGFMAHDPDVYRPSDVLAARRIADRFALCLSRERQIEASRRADEASDRASKLESRVRALTEELDARTGYRRVIGQSAPWKQVLTQATQVAATDTTVLLLGESGTGKEVVARFVHRGSPRRDGPFVALNCAALPEQLLEAELFGYERGAFTGATQSKPGQLEQAGGGTLFLDEVGEMSPPVQAKFLRVLQEREFQRLGGTRVLRTDARVVAATNRDLQQAMSRGQFREDLFYRLNVFAIRLPPLRERKDDVLPLSEAFLAEYGKSLGRPPAGISRDARQKLIDYHWPGNVRELRNILERAAILCDGGLITAEHLALTVSAVPRPPQPARDIESAAALAPRSDGAKGGPSGDLNAMERAMIEQALQTARFNKSKAAAALGLTRAQLYVRMKRYGLE
jgi:transcriptional regulator with GAF, ATPase, and Fis domain